MSVAFYPQMGVALFGSEATATKVGMGCSINASLFTGDTYRRMMESGVSGIAGASSDGMGSGGTLSSLMGSGGRSNRGEKSPNATVRRSMSIAPLLNSQHSPFSAKYSSPNSGRGSGSKRLAQVHPAVPPQDGVVRPPSRTRAEGAKAVRGQTLNDAILGAGGEEALGEEAAAGAAPGGEAAPGKLSWLRRRPSKERSTYPPATTASSSEAQKGRGDGTSAGRRNSLLPLDRSPERGGFISNMSRRIRGGHSSSESASSESEGDYGDGVAEGNPYMNPMDRMRGRTAKRALRASRERIGQTNSKEPVRRCRERRNSVQQTAANNRQPRPREISTSGDPMDRSRDGRQHRINAISGKKGGSMRLPVGRSSPVKKANSEDKEGEADGEAEIKAAAEDPALSDFGEVLQQSFRLDLDDVNGEVVMLKWGSKVRLKAEAEAGRMIYGTSARELARTDRHKEPVFKAASVMEYGHDLCNELVVCSAIGMCPQASNRHSHPTPHLEPHLHPHAIQPLP